MKKIRKQLTILTLTLAFILVFSGTVSAAQWDVGPTYTYQTIQNAIDNSNTLDGDVINVYPNGTGVYTENVIVNKNLTIKANSSGTVVNGSFTVTSAGSGSTIQGFTINKAPVQTPIFSENFDSVAAPTLPSGWAVQKTGGSEGNWATNVGTKHPSGQLAHSGSNLAYFNSWDAYTGNSARLYRTSGLDLSGLSSAQVSFWMYHDTSWYSSYDYVQLQISTNGGANWYSVSPAIYRYDGSSGWKEHNIDISAYTGSGMNDVRIGIFGYSGYGNDCNIDDITVKSGTAPVTNGIYLNSASGCTINGNTVNGFDNGNGIYLNSANGNTITGNIITNCINGINLYGSNNSLISGNNVSNNSNIGIFIQETSTGNNIINNIANNNGHGIYLNRFCDNNNIEGNTVTNSVLDGITMGASTGNTIKNNIISYNGRYGFWSNYYGNTIIGNNIFNNLNGIGLNNYVSNGMAETIHFNRIFNNTIFNLDKWSSANGIPDATYNWWGTNSQSAIVAKINGIGINYSPWLFMTINANPSTINNTETSLITVSFNNYSSDGTTYTPFDPATGHIPDGTPVTFNAERSIDSSSTTSGGIATATFTADGAPGEADVNAVTDSQTVNTSVMINSKSSLYLTVTPSKTNPVAGDTVIYTLKVGNNGPDTAENVVMTYVIPEGLEFVTASDDTGNTWTYDENTHTITWNLGSVPKGDPNLWLTLRVAQAGQYLINPALTTSSYDPTLNNNVQTFAFIATATPDDDQPDTNDTDDETTNNTVNAASKTVTMQETGLPLPMMVLAILMVLGGLIGTKRK